VATADDVVADSVLSQLGLVRQQVHSAPRVRQDLAV
jgi:hypothetical protein